MSKSIVLFMLLMALAVAAGAQYWQQQADFRIEVSLNDREHSLEAFEQLRYTNHSPDTLHFIWFHIWPNAYKNDKTAFSEQLLINGRTDFYFSNREQRGYINRLDFKVNGITAQTEDHPQYIDIIKLLLPAPLPPGGQVLITTPFHVQLPENFSRGGHTGQSYQITQWFPKPAVYDRLGWHPMPYLDQGEFYSEFGDYDVRITLPENYVVAATGELQNDTEKAWLQQRSSFNWKPLIQTSIIKKGSYRHIKKTLQQYPLSATKTKTLRFLQNKVHDFAWFADKRFAVEQDTLQLASGRIIHVYSFYLPAEKTFWKNSTGFIKKAIRFRSALLGEYPYYTASAVEAKMGFNGGMEYPSITSISPGTPAAELENTIEHEIGHNWLQGILASNERVFPWLDEGLNTYYDNRYTMLMQQNTAPAQPSFLQKRLPQYPEAFLLQSLIAVKKDQPINTPSEKFTELNYGLVAYHKTGEWMKLVEQRLGTPLFDSCMRAYYRQWQFRHPGPNDLKQSLETASSKNMDSSFALLDTTGALVPPVKKQVRPAFLFNFSHTEKYRYINILPAPGFNAYDKFMIGMLVHHYGPPSDRFQFLLALLYGTGSRALNGLGRISYTAYPGRAIQKIVYSLSAEKFSSNASLDSFGNKVFENFTKMVAGLRLYFKQPVLSSSSSSIDLRSFFIREQSFNGFAHTTRDSANAYPTAFTIDNRWMLQLSYDYANYRVLYPYQYQLQWQVGPHFYRLNANGHYFFNYAGGGGLGLRGFAAKFGYIGTQGNDAYRYQPKLLGVRGQEDYTYSNYFLGRTASSANAEGPLANKGIAGQQIMVRDGGLKLVLDQYDYLQGRSENWVAAINLNTTLPFGPQPEKFPLRLFLDVGTYSEAWQPNAPTSKFLYTAGLQLSLIKNLVNIYMPLLYSNDFKTAIRSLWPGNRLLHTISFSIDIQDFNLRKINRNLDF